MSDTVTDTTPAWRPPTASERGRILREARRIAIVGASADPARASNFVATYLLSSSADYHVDLIHPTETEILGRPVHPSLRDLPEPPDIVDVFRRADQTPAVAAEAVAVGAKVLWLQLGIVNHEAARIALEGGLEVVMDRCLKIEHARFHGGLHLAGFDTGLIDSRRRRPARATR